MCFKHEFLGFCINFWGVWGFNVFVFFFLVQKNFFRRTFPKISQRLFYLAFATRFHAVSNASLTAFTCSVGNRLNITSIASFTGFV